MSKTVSLQHVFPGPVVRVPRRMHGQTFGGGGTYSRRVSGAKIQLSLLDSPQNCGQDEPRRSLASGVFRVHQCGLFALKLTAPEKRGPNSAKCPQLTSKRGFRHAACQLAGVLSSSTAHSHILVDVSSFLF